MSPEQITSEIMANIQASALSGLDGYVQRRIEEAILYTLQDHLRENSTGSFRPHPGPKFIEGAFREFDSTYRRGIAMGAMHVFSEGFERGMKYAQPYKVSREVLGDFARREVSRVTQEPLYRSLWVDGYMNGFELAQETNARAHEQRR